MITFNVIINKGFKPIFLYFILNLLSFSLFAQDAVTFGTQRGFYDAAFNLSLSSPLSGATIRYTTNGTAPTISTGTVYLSPINITTTTCIRAIAFNASTTSRVYTSTYIFLNDVIHQPTSVPGWPLNTISTNAGSVVQDYQMDPNVVNSPLYSGSIINAMKSIPTLSLVMDKDQFWATYNADPATDIENPLSAEVIYPNDLGNSEQVDCGIIGHSWVRLKRSLRLKFKSVYGFSNFNTKLLQKGPLNGAGALTKLDNLILRAGNNDAWTRTSNPDRASFIRDEFYRSSYILMTGIGVHGNYVHLYINGLYWGLYNTVERPDEKFSAAYFGGAEADWLALADDGPKSGDATRFNYLSTTLIAKDMSIAANYNELKQYLDVTTFCDYMIDSWMIGMTDWPSKNFWGGNNNNPPSPFKYYNWDGEWSWGIGNGSSAGAWVSPPFRVGQSSTDVIPMIWHSARKNSDFMALFADRVNKHCFNNGVLTDPNVRQRWSTLANYIKEAVIGESARWGDGLNDGTTRTRNNQWQTEINTTDGLMNGNVNRFITALRAQGYYPTLDAPVYNSPGGSVSSGFQLTITNPSAGGTILYTKDGSDPRASGGNNAASALTYSGPVSISSSSTIKARVKNGSDWSALTEVSFTVTTSQITGLFMNEYMASNALTILDENGEADDWIELYNSTNQPIDIGGLFFTNKATNKALWKIPTTSPATTTIPAKGYKIVWCDKQPTQGPLHINFKLGASGENVSIYQALGSDTFALDQISFVNQVTDISEGRYPDGTNNIIDFNKPSPGSSNKISPVSNVFINEFLASNVADTVDEMSEHDDWIELYNNSDLPIDIGGYYITDNLSNPGLYQIPTGNSAQTTIPPRGFILLWADQQMAQGPLHVNLKLSAGGEQIGLFQKFGNVFAPLDSLSFTAQTTDVSFGRYPDASKNFTSFNKTTPIKPNIKPLLSGLFINEFLASNVANLADEFGEFDDWIEIYNSNNSPVDIGGLFITDNLTTPALSQIPTGNPAATTIPAKGYLLLWADKQLNQGPLHVDIKLSKNAEQIGLVQKNGSTITFLDSLTFGQQADDTSQGRLPDGGLTFVKFFTPTARATNVIIAANHPPVVNAGLSKSLTLPTNTTTLTGSASDPDGDAITYLWHKDSGPSCVFNDSTHVSLNISNLVAGSYIFRLTVKDSKGVSASDTAYVTVKAPAASGIQVISFTLINADSDTDIRTINVLDTINLGTLATKNLNVRANTFPATVGSVVFSLNGSLKTENGAPYSLKGDNGGDYTAWTPALTTYNLTATPYPSSGGGGTPGTPLSVKFLVINNINNKLPIADAGTDKSITLPLTSLNLVGTGSDPDGSITAFSWTKISGPAATMSGTSTSTLALTNLVQGTYQFRLTVSDNSNATAFDDVIVTVLPATNSGQSVVSFTLINADTDKDIKVITEGEWINLAQLPTKNLNIRANTNPGIVGSVVFTLNNKNVTENGAPYSLKGDNAGNYNPWTPALGDYVLTAKPFTASGGSGNPGTPLTVTFKVVNQPGGFVSMKASAQQPETERTPETVEMGAFPNPFSDAINIQFAITVTQHVTLEIYDEEGDLIQTLFDGIAAENVLYKFQFEGRGRRSGIYYSRLTTKTQSRSQRLVLLR